MSAPDGVAIIAKQWLTWWSVPRGTPANVAQVAPGGKLFVADSSPMRLPIAEFLCLRYPIHQDNTQSRFLQRFDANKC